MSGIGLASGEMIHCSEPVIHEHPLLARKLSKPLCFTKYRQNVGR